MSKYTVRFTGGDIMDEERKVELVAVCAPHAREVIQTRYKGSVVSNPIRIGKAPAILTELKTCRQNIIDGVDTRENRAVFALIVEAVKNSTDCVSFQLAKKYIPVIPDYCD